METCGLNSIAAYLILRVVPGQAGPRSKSELSSGSWLVSFHPILTWDCGAVRHESGSA